MQILEPDQAGAKIHHDGQSRLFNHVTSISILPIGMVEFKLKNGGKHRSLHFNDKT